MEFHKNKYEHNVDTFESITRIDVNIFSNPDIFKDSCIADPDGIKIPEMFRNNEPVPGGVLDIRLGSTDGKTLCGTCGESALTCPGHFGHIRLNDPMFHLGFMNFIKNILKCVCMRCFNLFIEKTDEQLELLRAKHGKNRMDLLKSMCKSVRECNNPNNDCGLPVSKISIEKKQGSIWLVAKHDDKKRKDEAADPSTVKATKINLTPKFCYDILSSITDENYILMGYSPQKSHPKDMIHYFFPVSPNPMRPSIKAEYLSAGSFDDDLTHKMIDIVKFNENLRNFKGDGSIVKNINTCDDYMFLQFHIATFFSNNTIGIPKSCQKNKKETKSVSERLTGKDGRVRKNLMGKRVNEAGRGVIVADTSIDINEVGVPLAIVKNLTYPECVNDINIGYLTELVENGPNNYPGANFVIRTMVDKRTGQDVTKMIKTSIMPDKTLRIGDVVHRHLMDGDVVMFNRQPSLHKLSLMGHRINVIEDPTLWTLRMNVNVTEPYNADFDGDEMSIHIPQSLQTMAELRLILSADQHFISPTHSNLVINAKQDTLMGSYVLTLEDIQIDWKSVSNYLMYTSVKLNKYVPKHRILSGKYVYSQIIPQHVNIIKRKGDGSYATRVVNGHILDGTFVKSDISAIIQRIWHQIGHISTMNFVDDLQRLILMFLADYGYTTSISDMIVPQSVHDTVYEIIETKRKEILASITEYDNDPYIMTSEAFETNIQTSLTAVQNKVIDTVMKNLNPRGGLTLCILSSSSGAPLNAGQIIGCVGQVIVEGKRIIKRYPNRTLPTTAQYDDSAAARGFCFNSFISGLSPNEFFFQAIAGREGVINTALKTAETGYAQRKLVKIAEDVKVEYDGTVRNANGRVIQFVYGDNGINPEKQINQTIQLIQMNNQQIQEQYIYNDQELAELRKMKMKYDANMNEQVRDTLINLRDRLRHMQEKLNTSLIAIRESYMIPIDLHQIIANITAREENAKIADPVEVIECIENMLNHEASMIVNGAHTSAMKARNDRTSKFMLTMYLYDVLAPKKCTHKYKLSKQNLNDIFAYYVRQMHVARVDPGEMVGFVSGQSIGEPFTQGNLKSFQKSGTGMTVTSGLSRAEELWTVSKNMKTPITRILFEKAYANNLSIVQQIASHLKYTTFNDIYQEAGIYFDPNPRREGGLMQLDDVNNMFDAQTKDGCSTDINKLPWVIRFVLFKEKMNTHNITMLDIKTSFCYNWMMRDELNSGYTKAQKNALRKITNVAFVSNYDNSDRPIIHIRFSANNFNANTLINFQDLIIQKYNIKGIPGIINSSFISEEQYVKFNEDGSMTNDKHYVLFASGINMDEISRINGIHLEKTSHNDLVLSDQMYGIEAARTLLIKELIAAAEGVGSSVNYQHIELLADIMTFTGQLISANRHGSQKLGADILSRASFETTVDQMLHAAAFAESDYMRSVSACIMAGTYIKGGTGAFELLLDHTKLKTTLKYAQQEKDLEQLTNTNVMEDIIRRRKMRA